MHNLLKSVLIICIPCLSYYIFNNLQPSYAIPLSLSISSALFWFLELLPLSLTALLIILGSVFFKILSIEKVFSIIFGEIITILAAIITISYALQKHHCEKQLVNKLIHSKLASKNLRNLLWLLGLSSFFISMWISNTATCAMILPLILGVLNQIEPSLTCQKKLKNIRCHTLLLCTYSASLGGLATPIGSPPNLIAMDFLTRHDIEVSFLAWIQFMLPLALIALFIAMFILNIYAPLPAEVRTFKFSQPQTQRSLNSSQIKVLLLFVFAILCWILPEIFTNLIPEKYLYLTRYPIILSALLLFVVKDKTNQENHSLLSLSDIKNIEWKALIIFIAGICLGSVLTDSGAAKFIISLIKSNDISLTTFFAIISGMSVLLSEFISNTASASVLIPMLYEFIQEHSNLVSYLILSLTFFTSLGFMLPTSTVPNALVYATGRIKLKDMIKIGLILDISTWLVIFLLIHTFML